MRRSCGPRGSRNDSIGYRPGLRVRENSCSASLAQERVALHLVLHLPKVAFAFTWTLGRLLVITTKRSIDSRALSHRMGGVHPRHLSQPSYLPKVRLESFQTFGPPDRTIRQPLAVVRVGRFLSAGAPRSQCPISTSRCCTASQGRSPLPRLSVILSPAFAGRRI